MSDLIYRHPQKDDLEAVVVFARTMEAEDTFILLNPNEPVTDEEEVAYLKKTLEEIAKKTQVNVWVFDGPKMIGSAAIKQGDRRKRHIGTFGISVLKEYRGKHIGKELAKRVLDQAKHIGIRSVVLECFVPNTTAQNLYHSLGFVDCGRIPKAVLYKGEYLDELVMVKEL